MTNEEFVEAAPYSKKRHEVDHGFVTKKKTGRGVVELFWKGAEKVTNVRDFAIKDTQRSF